MVDSKKIKLGSLFRDEFMNTTSDFNYDRSNLEFDQEKKKFVREKKKNNNFLKINNVAKSQVTYDRFQLYKNKVKQIQKNQNLETADNNRRSILETYTDGNILELNTNTDRS